MYRILLFLTFIGISELYQFKNDPLGSEVNIGGYGGSGGFRSSGFGGLSGGGGGGGKFRSTGFGSSGGFSGGLSGGCRNRARNNGQRLLRKPSLDTIVTQIARQIIDADQKIQGFCNSHADHYLRETYGMEYYKLNIAVDDFDEESISVKVIHKLVFISAEDCLSTYADLRLLPDVVDTANGMWKYSLGELSIYFPYIIRPEEQVEKNCGAAINPQVIVVPKCDLNTVIHTDYPVKFGDVSFRNSYKNFFSTYNIKK